MRWAFVRHRLPRHRPFPVERPGRAVAAALAAAVLFVPLAIPLLSGQVFPQGDIAGYHLPVRFLYHHALRAGDSFLWSSALGNGLYLHGEGQAGMAHPLHLAWYWLLPLGVALNVEMLSSYAFATAGMWLLLRRLDFERTVSFAGALLFAFSGFNLLHLNHLNMVAVVAHIPWLLWAADLLLAGREPRARALGFAGIALTIGSQFLLGFPQSIYFGLLILGWFWAWRTATLFTGPAEAGPGRAALSRLWLLGAALATGALIGAAQILPTLDVARESWRAATTADFRLSFSLHPWNLVQLFSPYMFERRIYSPDPAEPFIHEFGIYSGALGTLSLFWIAMRWRTFDRRPLALALGGLAAAGLVLALGRYGGVYPLLSQLPGLSGFRAPARHILLVHFAFAGLAALVLQDVRRLAQQPARPPWRALWMLLVPVGASLLLSIGSIALAGSDWAAANRLELRGPAALAGTALLAATAALLALSVRGARLALPLLIVVMALDLALWGTRYVWAERPVAIHEIRPVGGLPPEPMPGDRVLPHIHAPHQMNLYVLRGLGTAVPYVGLVRTSALDLTVPAAQRVAGINWVWEPAGWRRVEDPMPRVRMVGDWQVSTDPHAGILAIDVSRTALVDAALPPPGEPAGTATVLVDRPGRLAVATRGTHAQLLVTTERFHPGWTVDASGQALPVVRAYGDYLAAHVPAGVHEVVLTFAPASARWGFRITLAGLAVLLAAVLALRRRA